MWNMNDVHQATHVRDHVVFLEFDDGTSGEVDLAPYLDRGPIFKPLADIAYFKEFRLEGGTLAWANGADIAPERLYELVLDANQTVQRTGASRSVRK
jgi:hypothetical protein